MKTPLFTNATGTTLARIEVRGIVQGVGFRPFVYRLAKEHGLKGWVHNTSAGVKIEVEGDHIETFVSDLESKAPPMARIESITSHIRPAKGYEKFEIRDSLRSGSDYQLVSPDIATCPECRADFLSPQDRRYRYPFTNCTNCGPRFTIIEGMPYDRPATTMRRFPMCPACRREYEDPLDRRFHAQPNACPECGPHLRLVDDSGEAVPGDGPIHTAATLLKEGKIIAVKGLGGFLLSCDATNRQTVDRLRERKRRPAKPFAVMLRDLNAVHQHCQASPAEAALLASPQSPIVLLRWKDDSTVCPAVAPLNKYLGVMLPYTPLHHLLLEEVETPLVMTSGNLSEEPIITENEEALRQLNGIADDFLVHDRGISSGYDDSVFIVEGDSPRAVRRARGYAPHPISLPFPTRHILACGAQEKNTFCLTRDTHAFVSQHIGDMQNAETLAHYERTLGLYQRLFRIEPDIVAYDLHPEYLSTKFAREALEAQSDLSGVAVQHHHAHVASCLAENGRTGPVIGVAFDGTGYGTDGAIWGGEFLIADCNGFERAGHLEYVPMPGGTAAIRKPYRMALAYLSNFGFTYLDGLPLLAGIDPVETDIMQRQVEQGINAPLTSSAGRLFDAVAAIAGVRGEISYEAQAAIELEMLAPDHTDNCGSYPFSISNDGSARIVQLRDLIYAILEDVRGGVPVPLISARFHNTVCEMIISMCRIIRDERGLRDVALSGGVFQNRLLLGLVTGALEAAGFTVLIHSLVPSNDGGISLGQAAIAACRFPA